MAQPTRCGWAGPEPIYLDYHDHEWGRPTHDDRALFELLSLEGMQAGLSWIPILKKREAFRAAFASFDPAAVARFDEAKVEELMGNAGIVRNHRKIVSVIENAKHFLEIQREFGSFDRFLWAYVDGKPIVNSPETDADVPRALRDALGREAEPYITRRGQKWHVDLKGVNARWLEKAGVTQIDVCPDCTACRPDLYWSHRRMGQARGAQIAMICL